mgnify:CR=1 FL=1
MKINRKKLNDLKLDLVILAGGKGTRISKYLGNLPKPMLKFNQKSFLKYLIQNFSKYPFRKIYILTGYKFQSIHKEFNNKVYNFVPIECINEKKLMGTGGALLGIKNKIKKHFILINGDTIFDVNPYDLVKLSKSNVVGAVALVKNKNQSSKKLNLLRIKNKKVLFSKNGRLMNGGVYYFKKSIFNYLQKRNHSLENDVLPQLIKYRKINGKIFNEFFLDIGTPKYYRISENKLKNYYQKPVAFLDRDGVINYDRAGYVYRMKDFIFRKNVIEGLNHLNKKNCIALMIDQRVSEGEKIDFFGKPALTTTLPAQLALKYKIPIIPVFIERDQNDNFKIKFYQEIEPKSFNNKSDLTDKLNKVIEEMILRLNGQTKVVLEAFDPEGGAYGIGRTHGHRH